MEGELSLEEKVTMRLAAIVAVLLIAGCDNFQQEDAVADVSHISDDAPFKYHGVTLHFPEGSVDGRIEEGQGLGPWARLIPDAPESGEVIDARYYIDLGRSYTGKFGPSGYALGYSSFSPNALRLDLGDKYVLYCQSPERMTPAFNCAALLRSLPFAAIQFREKPASVVMAREMVDHAEVFLASTKGD